MSDKGTFRPYSAALLPLLSAECGGWCRGDDRFMGACVRDQRPVCSSVPLSWDRGNGIEARPRPRPLNTRHYLILLYYDSGEF